MKLTSTITAEVKDIVVELKRSAFVLGPGITDSRITQTGTNLSEIFILGPGQVVTQIENVDTTRVKVMIKVYKRESYQPTWTKIWINIIPAET